MVQKFKKGLWIRNNWNMFIVQVPEKDLYAYIRKKKSVATFNALTKILNETMEWSNTREQ